LLQRRHIKIDHIKFIGKESNRVEDVDAGLVHSDKSAYTEYVDPKCDEWKTKIQPALNKVKLGTLIKECRNQLSRRELIELRAGRASKPHRRNRELLVSILRRLGLI
jgi:hypothetical protein